MNVVSSDKIGHEKDGRHKIVLFKYGKRYGVVVRRNRHQR